MEAPKYDVGTDIIVWRGNLPDKIHICDVYKKEKSVEWMYHVMSEQSGRREYIGESSINNIVSRHSQPVYNLQYIKDLYGKGFLWCKNVSKRDIQNMVDTLNEVKEISQILISRHAFYPNGNKDKGKYAIWIKY